MDVRKRTLRIIMFLIAVLLVYRLMKDKQDEMVLNEISGTTMGSIGYTVKFYSSKSDDLKPQVDSLLKRFNKSLSTYDTQSELSRFNLLDTIAYETPFLYPVLRASREVYENTQGAFDPTIGPLVSVWGFGPDKNTEPPSDQEINRLLALVGFDKVAFDKYYVAKEAGVQLDFSAIAKGYAVDLVGKLLKKRKITDYMIEIGGEVITSGKNGEEYWKIGIEDPLSKNMEQRIFSIVKLENLGLATSGNYRNYYESNGKIFAHILDPRTGYTNDHNLLSASLFAQDCMKADAYATACMVIGLEASIELVNSQEGLEAFLIYRGDDGLLKTYISGGIAPYISQPSNEPELN